MRRSVDVRARWVPSGLPAEPGGGKTGGINGPVEGAAVDVESDVAVVGAGAAGLSLALIGRAHV